MEENLDPDACYRALCARDPRFDGVFFIAVKTTGIYCRAVCPARTPGRDRCVFYRTPAEAERAGFRACFRCRPEIAPRDRVPATVPRIVATAAARIEAGALNEGSLDDLADELGVTARHLRRAMNDALGVSPVELAQTCRLALAKQLLHEGSTSLADVAFASGFSSVRRFNALFKERFSRSPGDLRRSHRDAADVLGIPLTLGFREPFAWESCLAFLRARAIAGVEHVGERTYARTVSVGERSGWITAAKLKDKRALRVVVSPSLAPVLMPIAARVRRLFDLDARPELIAAHLSRDPALKRRVRAIPGLRVTGAFDGFEIAVRAVLGQQVSVAAARTFAGRLVAAYGTPVTAPDPELRALFPSALRLASRSVDLATVGLTTARARTLKELASAVASGRLRLDLHADPAEAVAGLEALPGIGPWTAQYVAMRAFGAPDAFPGGDLVLLKNAGLESKAELETRAERWRPWRAYAAAYLWSTP